MKNLTSLLIVLMYLVFCLPARGELLVYKGLWSGEGFWLNDFSNPDDPNTAQWYSYKETDKFFFVMDVNLSDPNKTSIESVQSIDYWRDGSELFYEIIDMNSVFSLIQLNYLTNKNYKIWVSKIVEDGNQLSLCSGRVKNIDIGLGAPALKRAVAPSLKGKDVYEGTSGGTIGDEDLSTGSISLSLDAKWTKRANNSDPNKGFDQDMDTFLDADSNAPQGLINWLESKGYVED